MTIIFDQDINKSKSLFHVRKNDSCVI